KADEVFMELGDKESTSLMLNNSTNQQLNKSMNKQILSRVGQAQSAVCRLRIKFLTTDYRSPVTDHRFKTGFTRFTRFQSKLKF
ncbi:MAG TPA: hypothetical protein DCL86_15020, partial [Bacteroidales bacterium]|nr:hypothetical protein [Bacteroidales bacterium]